MDWGLGGLRHVATTGMIYGHEKAQKSTKPKSAGISFRGFLCLFVANCLWFEPAAAGLEISPPIHRQGIGICGHEKAQKDTKTFSPWASELARAS